jgi:hypothetical protein
MFAFVACAKNVSRKHGFLTVAGRRNGAIDASETCRNRAGWAASDHVALAVFHKSFIGKTPH